MSLRSGKCSVCGKKVRVDGDRLAEAHYAPRIDGKGRTKCAGSWEKVAPEKPAAGK